MMVFYLGTHRPSWLGKVRVPLFVSRRVMPKRRFTPAVTPWVLDSGGFTELNMHGGWSVSPSEYAREVRVYQSEVGLLRWAAPMDWMCEPGIVAKTGLTVGEHQRRTVANFQHLRAELGSVIVPVVQGWTRDDYQRCVELYDQAHIDLYAEPVVGVGSICRRGQDAEIGDVLRSLAPLRMHAFGVRGRALAENLHLLASADSMAWSYAARMDPPLPGCSHKSCANCVRYALRWRERLLTRAARATPQLRLEVA